MDQLYLYVALIGVVFVLFALTRQGKAVQNAAAQKSGSPDVPPVSQADEELKTMLDEFMNELERDNARLLESFAKLQSEYKQRFEDQAEQIDALTVRVAELEKRAAEAPLVMPVPEAEPETTEPTSFFAFNEKYAKVVELSRQGKTAEQIARETDMGMGEINLVLGLAKREERLT